jgi:phosphoadenylyl-sulfate reductase (thioredoxin)
VKDSATAEWSAELEGRTPAEILRWTADRFAPRVAFGTGFGAEGCVLVHLIAEHGLPIEVFTLDTGLLFAETYELWRRLESRYGIPIRAVRSPLSLAEQAAAHGDELWSRDPDRCCRIRKVVPLQGELSGFDAWITAIRRDQTPERAHATIVERGSGGHGVKVNPLVAWRNSDVWAFVRANHVPYNPLHDRGYPSIGCAPCTTPVAPAEDPRAGRWRGRPKTECGLHVAPAAAPLQLFRSRPQGA